MQVERTTAGSSGRRQRRRRRHRRRLLLVGAGVVLLVAGLASFVVARSGTLDSGVSATARPRAHRSAPIPTTAATAPPSTTTTIPPPPAVAPRVDHVVTTDPVVFVTIDDGWHPLPDVLAFLQARHAPVTAFLIAPIAQRDADFYRQVIQLGGTVENHTMHHADLARLSLSQQAGVELCPAADLIGATFGRRPLLARPPGGAENQFTDRAVGYCGMYATVRWDAKFSDHQLSFARPGGPRPGDIVLMHWGPGLLQDLRTLFPLLDAAGLHPAPLQDYIGPTATHTGTTPSVPTVGAGSE
ncbi:MAG TPA: polysaccharide deacetylase family protein [Acidimicrobiia bacterium]|nr:polysaccharide deacetylase family protein [Acidimicrobiia bacterium]HEV3451139.1 polysaccharide deacetylase family protein [Acidimicrobiia bacterium]